MTSKIQISEDVAIKAIRLGLTDSIEESVMLLRSMVGKAAPVTHPYGSLRFEDWVFTLEDNTLTTIHYIQCKVCEDRRKIAVYDVCQDCGGGKCKRCRYTGEVKSTIPCGVCTK